MIEAYGFDLSPIAARHGEFVRVAEAARAERITMGRLRRRATIARKGIIQILETAAEYGFDAAETGRNPQKTSNPLRQNQTQTLRVRRNLTKRFLLNPKGSKTRRTPRHAWGPARRRREETGGKNRKLRTRGFSRIAPGRRRQAGRVQPDRAPHRRRKPRIERPGRN
ncbi:MAG: hypothetical protein J2P48_18270 [Alphaproteobacteria bacterium]|nr:hypothetical protein [Alphaproteobacteria bacterium]